MERVRCERLDMIGKVPWRNEYVRPVSPSPLLSSFDEWLAKSTDAATRNAAGWGEAYPSGALQAFVFGTGKSGAFGLGAPQMLAGVVAPSEDGAGRQFPVALAGTLVLPSSVGANPEVLPLLVEEFWQGASDLLPEVKAGGAADARFRMLQSCFEFPAAGAKAAYGEWIAALTVEEFWVLLYGQHPARTVAETMEDVVAAVRPFRGVEHPRTALTLRLPLGSAAGAAVCFWVDVVRRAARWRATIPSFFWSHDGQSGSMLLHLGDPPASTLAELWGPKRDRDEIFDLTSPGAGMSPTPRPDTAEVGAPGAREEQRISLESEPLSNLLARVGAS
jgi:type VI secretion system ImpM family protein